MSKRMISALLCLFILLVVELLEQRNIKKLSCAYWNKRTQDDVETLEKQSYETVSRAVREENARKVYLSFDDGPSKNTEKVLDILKEEQVPATFFLIGNQVNEQTKALVLRQKEEGHLIGVHTYSHEGKEIYSSAETYLEDFNKAEKVIMDVTGEQPVVCRFPFGSATDYLGKIASTVIPELEARGYTYFDWNVSGEDSIGHPCGSQIFENVKKDYDKYKESVVLLHDSAGNECTTEILQSVIKLYKEKGYTFDTLDHMENPCQYARD